MTTTYKYEFVTETIEIEIDEDWAAILSEIDREEYNNNHRETRRHERLDHMKDSSWLICETAYTDDCYINDEMKGDLMQKAKGVLSEKQFDAFEKICLEEYSESEYALMRGITQQAAHSRVGLGKKRLRKVFKGHV